MSIFPPPLIQLSRFRQAVDAIIAIGIQVIRPSARDVSNATAFSQQFGLLSGDALIAVLMRDNGLVHLASADSDFDRVPNIIRCTPV